MIYTPKTKQAMKLCFIAHKDQMDKSGLPYVFHPFHLAEQMEDEDSTVVALLHDVVEDTDYTLDDLRDMGFDEQIIDALSLLTHDKDVPYLEYVAHIKQSPIARAVKLADLHHNSDITRLDSVTKRDVERVLKYKMAEAVLAGDRYDVSGGYYQKVIPLDHKKLYFLSIFYTPDRILKYSVDVEAAADSHYDFDDAAAHRLKALLPEAESLPEALAKYFAHFNEFQFSDLMKKHGITYEKSFFPNFDDMD